MKELRADRARAVEAALDRERAMHPIDEEAARLAVAEMMATSTDERMRTREALLARMGVADQRHRLGLELRRVVVTRDHSKLHIQAGYLSPQQIDAAMKPMLSWLCAQQCIEEHLLIDKR